MTTQDPPIRHTTHRLETFHGLPVRDVPRPGEPRPTKAEAARTAWRVAVDPAGTGPVEDFEATFDRFLDSAVAPRARALVIGQWSAEVYTEDSRRVVRLLASAAGRLTGLRALFLGDLVPEEAEVSWIAQSDVTALLGAYPRLEELVVRGGSGLAWGVPHHPGLRRLSCEGNGLSGELVRSVGATDLPALTSLELWLGAPEWGGTASPDDLAALLCGDRLPQLRRLGLRNSAAADAVAAAVATSPLLSRLRSLSLAGGRLSDRGAAALLTGRSLAGLTDLDLRGHALSEDMTRRLAEELTDQRVQVDLTGRLEPAPRLREGWLCAAVDE